MAVLVKAKYRNQSIKYHSLSKEKNSKKKEGKKIKQKDICNIETKKTIILQEEFCILMVEKTLCQYFCFYCTNKRLFYSMLKGAKALNFTQIFLVIA